MIHPVAREDCKSMSHSINSIDWRVDTERLTLRDPRVHGAQSAHTDTIPSGRPDGKHDKRRETRSTPRSRDPADSYRGAHTTPYRDSVQVGVRSGHSC